MQEEIKTNKTIIEIIAIVIIYLQNIPVFLTWLFFLITFIFSYDENFIATLLENSIYFPIGLSCVGLLHFFIERINFRYKSLLFLVCFIPVFVFCEIGLGNNSLFTAGFEYIQIKKSENALNIFNIKDEYIYSENNIPIGLRMRYDFNVARDGIYRIFPDLIMNQLPNPVPSIPTAEKYIISPALTQDDYYKEGINYQITVDFVPNLIHSGESGQECLSVGRYKGAQEYLNTQLSQDIVGVRLSITGRLNIPIFDFINVFHAKKELPIRNFDAFRIIYKSAIDNKLEYCR